MFRSRFLTAVVVLPVAIAAIVLGELWFLALIGALLSLAIVEFCQLMRRAGSKPAPAFAIALLWVLLIDAQFPQWRVLQPGVALVLGGSLTWQLAHREGNPTADWALSIAGPLYLGWCGAHFIHLRALPDGLWWTLTAIPAIWLADSGAYFIGRRWGRRKLAPALSPGKTWEGWAGGLVVGSLLTAGLAGLWNRLGAAAPTVNDGWVLGLVISAVAPLGDLAISMIKRQVGAKDTGTIFPGHGGALDRVDSILWAAVIGYYLALSLGA